MRRNRFPAQVESGDQLDTGDQWSTNSSAAAIKASYL
jgi:hypothetical protein